MCYPKPGYTFELVPLDDEIKNKNQPTNQEKTATTTTFVPSPAVNEDNMKSNKTCWV